ncbi:DsbA family protein [Agrococcus beijingensis]|uniref:DsbA family protein n=1 Tax=Agrococcus beijingensis TaxID=3068634 RepID=UPI002740B78B|nr:thioredoxin domain-containing protein [Agrococcus sp. REN33]
MNRSAAVSIATVVGALVLIVAVALLVVRPWESAPAAQAPAASGAAAPELVDETTHLLTDAGPDAPVVVEFFDYECPGCGSFQPVVEDLVDRYGAQVTFAVRYFPLPSHSNALPAAVAAEAAAQQDAFAEMHTMLFDRQQEWRGSDATATFRGYAEELGLDMAAFDAAVADPDTLDRVAFDANAGIALGVQSTPTFYVDGEQVDLEDFDDVETAIQAALGE